MPTVNKQRVSTVAQRGFGNLPEEEVHEHAHVVDGAKLVEPVRGFGLRALRRMLINHAANKADGTWACGRKCSRSAIAQSRG